MHSINKYIVLISFILTLIGCQESENVDDSFYNFNYNAEYSNQKVDCNCEDGSESATIEYYDPYTRSINTYNADVEIEDCKVTTIEIPKRFRVNNSQISPSEIDEDGNAELADERGRTFRVQLNNDFLFY